jgi:chromosome segregation ATPase
MNKAEIIEKRKALEEQILADEKEVSVLESKIKEGSEKLGIKDDVASIEAALQEKTALLHQKEKEVNDILEKIEDLEKEKPVELLGTVLPEVIHPNPSTSVKVEKPVPEYRTDIIDGEDELE